MVAGMATEATRERAPTRVSWARDRVIPRPPQPLIADGASALRGLTIHAGGWKGAESRAMPPRASQALRVAVLWS